MIKGKALKTFAYGAAVDLEPNAAIFVVTNNGIVAYQTTDDCAREFSPAFVKQADWPTANGPGIVNAWEVKD